MWKNIFYGNDRTNFLKFCLYYMCKRSRSMWFVLGVRWIFVTQLMEHAFVAQLVELFIVFHIETWVRFLRSSIDRKVYFPCCSSSTYVFHTLVPHPRLRRKKCFVFLIFHNRYSVFSWLIIIENMLEAGTEKVYYWTPLFFFIKSVEKNAKKNISEYLNHLIKHVMSLLWKHCIHDNF